jgi:hypothetical protein
MHACSDPLQRKTGTPQDSRPGSPTDRPTVCRCIRHTCPLLAKKKRHTCPHAHFAWWPAGVRDPPSSLLLASPQSAYCICRPACSAYVRTSSCRPGSCALNCTYVHRRQWFRTCRHAWCGEKRRSFVAVCSYARLTSAYLAIVMPSPRFHAMRACKRLFIFQLLL